MLARRLRVERAARRQVQKAARGAVPQPTAAEVHTDPHPARLVLEQVDVMVARADGAKLLPCLLLQLAHVAQIVPCRVVEQWMIDGLAAGATHAEHHGLRDRIHNRLDVGAQIVGANIGAACFVAARNIVAHAARRHGVAVRGHTADRHRVATVPVGAKHSARYLLICSDPLDLRDSCFVMFTENGDAVDVLIHYSFSISRSVSRAV